MCIMFHMGVLMPYLKPWINQILFSLSKQSGGGKPSKHKSQSGRNCAEICLKSHKKGRTVQCPVQMRVLTLYGSSHHPLCPSSVHGSSDLGSLSNLWLPWPSGTKTSQLSTECTIWVLWGWKWKPECCSHPRACFREVFSVQVLILCLPSNSSHVQRPNKLSCNPGGKDQSWFFLPYCICCQKSRRIYLW